MNPQLTEIIRNSESRYMTPQEQRAILDYTESLPRRFQAAALVQDKEEAIVASVVQQGKRRYANMERYHPKAWEKAARDLELILRYTAQAMVLDDPTFQADRLLYWFGTILHSFGFSPQFNRDTYTFLLNAVRGQLPPDAFGLLEPFLQKNIEVLGSIPEPAQVLV
jgi:hypothetical protein